MNMGIKEANIKLEHPTELSHGDYSTNVAFMYSKNLLMTSKDLAGAVKKHIDDHSNENIEKIEVAGGGFINFFLSKRYFELVLEYILYTKKTFGFNKHLQGKTWLIEHTSPNPNKAMHLGHLRNNITGMAIANIAEANGVTVIRDAVDNNRGIAIAKLMWGYLKFANAQGKEITDIDYWYNNQEEWQTPEDKNMRSDRFVDYLYVKASDDFKNETVEKAVRDLVVKWEANEEKVLTLWKKVLSYSYKGQEMTLKRLGNKWDYVWHEDEHYAEGKNMVTEGIQKGVFQILSDGAVLTNLEKKYNLSDTIVQKKDGTSLYITQDLALTKLKKEKFNPDKMFWVIGPEQSLAMKQMFAVSEQLGIGNRDEFIHIPYGYMSLKDEGKMSSRKGTVIYIDDLIDTIKEKVIKKISESIKKSEIDTIAEKVALGAVKYSILKTARMTDTQFDIDTSISFEGDSGPYLQYTTVRAKSVLRKADEFGVKEEIGRASCRERV